MVVVLGRRKDIDEIMGLDACWEGFAPADIQDMVQGPAIYLFPLKYQPPSEFSCLNPNLDYVYKDNIYSMFKHFAHNLNRKIEKETEKLRHEEEMKELRAYLLGHGHDRVHPHILLAPGQVLMSKSKNYFAVVEQNGDFSIYVSSHFCKENRIWSTNTHGKGHLPHQLGIQNDGNVVLYDSQNKPVWSTNTGGRNKGETTLFLDDDGNLVLFDSQLNQLWESGTARGKE